MFKPIDFSKMIEVPLHSLHVGSKFYRKGYESPYFKVYQADQITLRCKCLYYQKKCCAGKVAYRVAYVHLSHHMSVYVDK